MRRALGFILVCVVGAAAWAQAPSVIDSIPRHGDLQVDPELGWMVFAFDRDMGAAYSFCGGGPTFPKVLDMPRWLDSRLIAVQIQLEPDREYQFTLNCPSAQGFRDVSGHPLGSYPIVFRTSGASAGLTPALNTKAVQELRRLIDEEYSYRDLRGIDWAGLFVQYQAALIRAGTAAEFAEIAATLLSQAKDLHITVRTAGGTIPTFTRQVIPNLNTALLPQIVPGFSQRSPAVSTGTFPDGIGYVLITTWDRNSEAAIEPAYSALWEPAHGSGLIIDVRPNTGGDETLARQVAGCFVEESCVYAKHVLRSVDSEGGFTPPLDRLLSPNRERPRYRGPVVVLMGRTNVSSCESFLLMMKQVPGCTLVGERSYGSSGNPLPHDLDNGVTVLLPSWKDLRPDGTCFEAEGIEPDVEVVGTPEQLATGDPVLEAALAWLRTNER